MDDDPTSEQQQTDAANPTSQAPPPLKVENSAPDGADTEDASQGSNAGGQKGKANPIIAFVRRLTVSEWLTFLVGVGGLAVSALTYMNASDTKDIKSAIKNLSELAAQTKRQADAQSGQLGLLGQQVTQVKEQTKAIAKGANASESSAAALTEQLAVQQRTFEETYRPRIKIAAKEVADFKIIGEKITISASVSFLNAGNTQAQYIIQKSEIKPFTEAIDRQHTLCAEGDRAIKYREANNTFPNGAMGIQELPANQTDPMFIASLLINGDLAPFKYVNGGQYATNQTTKYVGAVLVGCFAYEAPATHHIHHTRFLFSFEERQTDGSYFIISANPHIPVPGSVRMIASPIAGNGED